MPFTFVHPAIVIPVKNKWYRFFDLTGLVLGSMAPDFEYFLRFMPLGVIGHTVKGFFYFNLPLCFIVAYLFHYFVKRVFIINMPSPLDNWYYYIVDKKWVINNFRSFIVFVYSALIGMASHVFWDSFTHKTGYFVNKFLFLKNTIRVMNYHIPVYKFIQHGSTIVGGIVILIYLYKIRDTRNKAINKGEKDVIKKDEICKEVFIASTSMKMFYWISILVVTKIILLYRVFFTLNGFHLKYFGIYVVSFLSSFILATIVVSIAFNIYELIMKQN